MQQTLWIALALSTSGCKPRTTQSDTQAQTTPLQDQEFCCLERWFQVPKLIVTDKTSAQGRPLQTYNLTQNCSLMGPSLTIKEHMTFSVTQQKVDLKFNAKGGSDSGFLLAQLFHASGEKIGKKSDVSLYCWFEPAYTIYDVTNSTYQQMRKLFVTPNRP